MFPYPSGSGLHVGHVVGYTASDIMARFWRHQVSSIQPEKSDKEYIGWQVGLGRGKENGVRIIKVDVKHLHLL